MWCESYKTSVQTCRFAIPYIWKAKQALGRRKLGNAECDRFHVSEKNFLLVATSFAQSLPVFRQHFGCPRKPHFCQWVHFECKSTAYFWPVSTYVYFYRIGSIYVQCPVDLCSIPLEHYMESKSHWLSATYRIRFVSPQVNHFCQHFDLVHE